MNNSIATLNFPKKTLILLLLIYSSHKACAQYHNDHQADKNETLEVIAYPVSGNPLSVVVKFDNASPKDLITILILNSYKRVLHRESVKESIRRNSIFQIFRMENILSKFSIKGLLTFRN